MRGFSGAVPRIVVTANGEIVRNLWVPDAELVRCVVELIETMPDLPLYIEGDELPAEQRTSLLYQAAEVRAAQKRLTQDLAPAEFKQVVGALALGLEEVRQGCEELRRMQLQGAREFGVLVQTHNRAVLEDSVRARHLLHQCIDDIDAIDRGVAVAKLKRGLEPPRTSGAPPVVVQVSEGGFVNRAKSYWRDRHEGGKK